MTQNVRINDRIEITEDVALNDSDKSFTVPTDEEWDVLTVQVELISTADVGNRQIAVEAQGAGSEVLGRWLAGVVQAASVTNRYNFGPGLADQTTLRTLELTTPMPRLRLGPGMVLRVFDLAAIAAAADDMEVRLLVARRGT